jgi:hypothetical protein
VSRELFAWRILILNFSEEYAISTSEELDSKDEAIWRLAMACKIKHNCTERYTISGSWHTHSTVAETSNHRLTQRELVYVQVIDYPVAVVQIKEIKMVSDLSSYLLLASWYYTKPDCQAVGYSKRKLQIWPNKYHYVKSTHLDVIPITAVIGKVSEVDVRVWPGMIFRLDTESRWLLENAPLEEATEDPKLLSPDISNRSNTRKRARSPEDTSRKKAKVYSDGKENVAPDGIIICAQEEFNTE